MTIVFAALAIVMSHLPRALPCYGAAMSELRRTTSPPAGRHVGHSFLESSSSRSTTSPAGRKPPDAVNLVPAVISTPPLLTTARPSTEVPAGHTTGMLSTRKHIFSSIERVPAIRAAIPADTGAAVISRPRGCLCDLSQPPIAVDASTKARAIVETRGNSPRDVTTWRSRSTDRRIHPLTLQPIASDRCYTHSRCPPHSNYCTLVLRCRRRCRNRSWCCRCIDTGRYCSEPMTRWPFVT